MGVNFSVVPAYFQLQCMDVYLFLSRIKSEMFIFACVLFHMLFLNSIRQHCTVYITLRKLCDLLSNRAIFWSSSYSTSAMTCMDLF